MDLPALFFGLFIGVFFFTVVKATQQTRSIWKHTHSLRNTYLYLVWGEALTNAIFAVTTILFINGVIEGALWYYILTVTLWAFQVQLLPQIIANRVALIMTNKRKALYLKLGLAAIITPVCIVVYYVWTSAHMDGATPKQVRLNFIFEKSEKAFFLIVDLTLNCYFLYLVRYNLIACGLNKYWRLFNFNCGMVLISTCLDALLLGFLSLENQFTYVQFAPLAYTIKLYIELVMARLISKVVRSKQGDQRDGHFSSNYSKSARTNHGAGNSGKQDSTLMSRLGKSKKPADRESSNGSDVHLAAYNEPHAITKTIETTVIEDDLRHPHLGVDANDRSKVYDMSDSRFQQSV